MGRMPMPREVINKLLQILLGIKPAPWAAGSRWSLDWLALPKHDRLLVLIVAIAFAAWGVLWLYRREGRGLSLPIRWSLATLRMVLLLGILAMLLGPVIVFSKQEFVPSNLLVLDDRSESMELRDAYVDPARANRLAEILKLPNGINDLRQLTRVQLAQQAMSRALREQLAANGDRVIRA